MNKPFMVIRNFIRERFNLDEDKADEQLIVESIKREVHFKGTNLWTLIFAILIASMGLNVNSTAVIIGAMLISPLMGPIMGIGLAIGTIDFELLQKGIKNLGIAAFISIATSALYFSITPLHDANSELLARTTPSLWDVFIAFFGGLAGIVAGTRREKSNVLPGVAIATALMPPLCTAGFGLATGNWYFLLGALYLFFINSLFICLASFLIVKHLRFQKKEFATKTKEQRVTRSILVIVILTILPSIYLAYLVVERSFFETNAKNFVQKEFNFKRTQVVTRNFKISGNQNSIELLLVGQELPQKVLDSLKDRMPAYGLDSVNLTIHQGLDAKKEIDLAQIKASILEDVFKKEKEDSLPQIFNKLELPVPDLRKEMKALYPSLKNYSLQPVIVYNIDSSATDTLTIFIGSFERAVNVDEQKKLSTWLTQRVKTDSVKVIIE